MAKLRAAPTQERSRRTLDSIMKSADTLFEQRGVDNTTMTEIASTAKVSIGTVYRFFPTKVELVEEYVDRYLEHLMSAESIELPETPTLDDLGWIVDAFFDRVVQTRTVFGGYGQVRLWRNPNTGDLASKPVRDLALAFLSGLLASSPFDIPEDKLHRMAVVIVDGSWPLMEGVRDLKGKARTDMSAEIKELLSGYVRNQLERFPYNS